MSARRIALAVCAAATLLCPGGAWGLYRDYFPSSADGSMNTYYGGGYAIAGDGQARYAKFDQQFAFIGFGALSDGLDGIAAGKGGDTGDGVLLDNWVVGKKIVGATYYVRDFANQFCDGVSVYFSEPAQLIGFRVSNAGDFTDRAADGSADLYSTCCAPFNNPSVKGGMNTPTAWRIGLGPYSQDGHIGVAGDLNGFPVVPEFYKLSLLDSANPGAEVKAANSFFDGDGDGFEGASGPLTGTDNTNLTDAMYAFEYILRHSDALVVNSQTQEAADCTPNFGSDEPRDAANDGAGAMGWYAVPVDGCIVKLLGSDPEMKGLVASVMNSPGPNNDRNTQFQTRDQSGDGCAPYLFVVATILGDVSNDGCDDIFDVIDVVTAFGTGPGDPNWNPEADFDCDLTVSIFDVIDAVTNFGLCAPEPG